MSLFLVILSALLAGGGALIVWALTHDRAKKQARCPKCWYAISPVEDEPKRCPECGRAVRSHADLYRTRRHWGWATAGVILILAAGLLIWSPVPARFLPDGVLATLAPIRANDWIVEIEGRDSGNDFARELADRNLSTWAGDRWMRRFKRQIGPDQFVDPDVYDATIHALREAELKLDGVASAEDLIDRFKEQLGVRVHFEYDDVPESLWTRYESFSATGRVEGLTALHSLTSLWTRNTLSWNVTPDGGIRIEPIGDAREYWVARPIELGDACPIPSWCSAADVVRAAQDRAISVRSVSRGGGSVAVRCGRHVLTRGPNGQQASCHTELQRILQALRPPDSSTMIDVAADAWQRLSQATITRQPHERRLVADVVHEIASVTGLRMTVAERYRDQEVFLPPTKISAREALDRACRAGPRVLAWRVQEPGAIHLDRAFTHPVEASWRRYELADLLDAMPSHILTRRLAAAIEDDTWRTACLEVWHDGALGLFAPPEVHARIRQQIADVRSGLAADDYTDRMLAMRLSMVQLETASLDGSISLNGPLATVTDELGEYIGRPLVVDLARVGMRGGNVRCTARGTSPIQVIDAFTESLGRFAGRGFIVWLERDGYIEVTSKMAAMPVLGVLRHPVDDLVDDAKSMRSLRNIIASSVTPEAWVGFGELHEALVPLHDGQTIAAFTHARTNVFIADLLRAIRDARARRSRSPVRVGGWNDARVLAFKTANKPTKDTMLDIISNVDPDAWADNGGDRGTIMFYEDVVIVSGDPPLLHATHDYLRDERLIDPDDPVNTSPEGP